jgi:hypothetical protein
MPGMTSDRERQAATAIRVRIALDSIDEAQHLIEQAMQALSAVDAMRPEHQKIACLSVRLTWTWFAVNAAANRLRRRARPAPHGT